LGDSIKSAKNKYEFVQYIAATGKKFLEDDCFTLGAAISFFASLSLLPLLLVIISFFGFLLASDFPLVVNFKSQLIQLVSNFHSDLGTLLEISIDTAMRARRLAGATGLLTLFLSGAVFFEQLTLALDKIWRVPHVRSFIKRKFISWVIFLTIIVMLFSFSIGELLLRTLVARLSSYIGKYLWLNWVYFLFYLFFAFLMLTLAYRFLPAAKVPWKSSLLGGLVATIALSFLNWVFSWYISKVNLASFFGPVGVGMLFLVWIYLFSLSLLLGGEVSYLVSSHNRAEGYD